MFSQQRSRWNGFVCLVLIGMGCAPAPTSDPSRASISGTITLGDKPLTGGSITLISNQDPNFRITGMIQADGRFSFDGAPVGAVRASVETDSLRYANPASFRPIPNKYKNVETSGLTYDVKPGNNDNVQFSLVAE